MIIRCESEFPQPNDKNHSGSYSPKELTEWLSDLPKDARVTVGRAIHTSDYADLKAIWTEKREPKERNMEAPRT